MLFEISNKIRVNLRFYWIDNFVKNKLSKRGIHKWLHHSSERSFINDVTILQSGMGPKVRKIWWRIRYQKGMMCGRKGSENQWELMTSFMDGPPEKNVKKIREHKLRYFNLSRIIILPNMNLACSALLRSWAM